MSSASTPVTQPGEHRHRRARRYTDSHAHRHQCRRRRHLPPHRRGSRRRRRPGVSQRPRADSRSEGELRGQLHPQRAPLDEYVFGSLMWSDGTHRSTASWSSDRSRSAPPNSSRSGQRATRSRRLRIRRRVQGEGPRARGRRRPRRKRRRRSDERHQHRTRHGNRRHAPRCRRARRRGFTRFSLFDDETDGERRPRPLRVRRVGKLRRQQWVGHVAGVRRRRQPGPGHVHGRRSRLGHRRSRRQLHPVRLVDPVRATPTTARSASIQRPTPPRSAERVPSSTAGRDSSRLVAISVRCRTTGPAPSSASRSSPSPPADDNAIAALPRGPPGNPFRGT